MNWIKDTIEYVTNLVKIWIIIQPWEAGIRVRLGKTIKLLTKGIYFRIPYIDSVYVQPIRLRVIQNPLQTLTTKDGQAVSIQLVVGYSICDILKLYKTLHQPDSTLSNMTLGGVSDYICTRALSEIAPSNLERDLMQEFTKIDYGVRFEYVKITGFVAVKTIRLIQDQSWMPQSISLEDKK